MSIAVTLGSSFSQTPLNGVSVDPLEIDTPWGMATVWRVLQVEGTSIPHSAYLLYRHGVPHRYLPNQIPYQAQAWALHTLGCTALLLTSSVGVLDASLPLYTPLFIQDLLMPDQRLPSGALCTIFDKPTQNQGHLVLDEGLCSQALEAQIRSFTEPKIYFGPSVTFAYVGGPRTKTSAENHFWLNNGAQVNSMTIGPELVLANELEIPTVGIVVGHKYSSAKKLISAKQSQPQDSVSEIRQSLVQSREAIEFIVRRFLAHGQSVLFRNSIYRFHHPSY